MDGFTVPPILQIIRVVVGPGLVFAGFAKMSSSFWWGIVWVYLGFVVCLAEAVWEPLILRLPYGFQIGIVCMVWASACYFGISVRLADAPLGVLAYSGGAGDDALIAGIAWNPKFADLRVALNNPNPEYYQDLNIVINPNAWTHKASILDGPNGCALSEEGGGQKIATTINKKNGADTFIATNAFGKLDFGDSLGNTFTPLAISSNYRLVCDHLPSHFTVQIIFAAVTLNNDLLMQMQAPQPKAGEWGISVTEFKPGSPKDSVWDFLGPKPHPSVIRLVGTYAKGARLYTIDRTEKVAN